MSSAQFNQAVAQERLRSVRRAFPFCVVTIDLNLDENRRRRTRKLVRMLNLNLRSTDQKGILGAGRYGVILVDTDESGGRTVVDRLAELAQRHELAIKMKLQVHDPSGFCGDEDDDQDSGHGAAESGRRRAVALAADGGSSLSNPHQSRRIDQSHGDLASTRNGVEVSSRNPWETPSRIHRVLKRSLDICGSAVGLVMTGPIILTAMWLVRRQDGKSAIFSQTREGLHGKPFTIYKLRTMVVDAEKKQAELREQSHRDGPAFKIARDPRVTPIGQLLRKTCVDELPQLWNVLKGDMSLVGPRPLPWDESRACASWHRRRLDVRPGMTCYWQVDKGAVESFDDWMRLDLKYLSKASVAEDIKLIAQTVVVPMTGRGSE